MIPDSSVKTNPRTEAFSPRGDRHQSVLRSIGNRSVLHLMCLLIAGLYHPSFPRRSTGTRGYFSPAAQPIHIFDRMNKIDKTTTPHCHCEERSDVAISSTHRATSPPFLIPTAPPWECIFPTLLLYRVAICFESPVCIPTQEHGNESKRVKNSSFVLFAAS